MNIDSEIKQAMLSKDKLRLSTVRALKTAFEAARTIKGRDPTTPLTEDEQFAIIRKQIAQRDDSIEQFSKVGATGNAMKEQAEKLILQAYLPQAMTDAEIENMINRAMIDSGAVTKRDMGKAIACAKELSEGRADMKMVSRLLAERLA